MEVLQIAAPCQQIAHVHVHRVKAGAVERRRHFNVGVHPLLAQHRHFRASALGDIRRGDVFLRCEGQLHVQTGILFILLGLMFLIGTRRVVAQALHLPGGFRPPGAQRIAAFAVQRLAVLGDDETIAGLHAADVMHVVGQSVLRERLFHVVETFGAHLDHRAQLFVEQHRQRIVTETVEIDVHAAVTGEGHLRQRHQQAAVGAVVVSQQRLIGHQLLHGVEEARQLRNVAHVGRFVAQLAVNLRQRGGTQRVMAVTQIDQQ